MVATLRERDVSLIGLSSEIAFRALEAADAWMGLPLKIESSLHFRRSFRERLPSTAPPGGSLWIHGASVGELEDLANFFLSDEALAESGWDPSRVVLTASSVSARVRLEKWSQERKFLYAGPLPPERASDVRLFLETLRPRLLLLSHSDVWPRLFDGLQGRLPGGLLWLPSRWPSPGLLKERVLGPCVRRLGLRDLSELEAARAQGYAATFVGHPRVDRILARLDRAASETAHPLESKDAQPDPRRFSVLLGSVWPEDAQLWMQALEQLSPKERAGLYLVAIPHDISDAHGVAQIQHWLPQARIVAQEGLLLESYRGFNLAYVGGGLGRGLHSVVEPALWRLPILCGPALRAQPLAPRLIELGALRTVRASSELAAQLRNAQVPSEIARWREAAAEVDKRLRSEAGATGRLARCVRELTLEKANPS